MTTTKNGLTFVEVKVQGHLFWMHSFGTYADGSPQVSTLWKHHSENCWCQAEEAAA